MAASSLSSLGLYRGDFGGVVFSVAGILASNGLRRNSARARISCGNSYLRGWIQTARGRVEAI